MTKSLTEKWKDGELGFGYYYIDFGIGGVPTLFNGLEFYCERTQKPNAIKTILAPVPSYEEYKKLQEQLKKAVKIYELEMQKAILLSKQDESDGILFNIYKGKKPIKKHILDYLKRYGRYEELNEAYKIRKKFFKKIGIK